MRYIDVIWLHDLQDEPYRLVSEIGEDNFEIRKLEFFRNGDVGMASTAMGTIKTMLGSVEVPTIEEINTDGEFQGRTISAQHFEELWLKYTV